MTRLARRLALSLLTLSLVLPSALVQAATRAEAEVLVKEAVAYMKEHGKGPGLAEISRRNGLFAKGDLYVFAYNLDMVSVAHPYHPDLLGRQLHDIPDAQGKLFRLEIQAKALSDGSGWVNYQFENPKEHRLEAKSSYFELYQNLILCAGVYREEPAPAGTELANPTDQ